MAVKDETMTLQFMRGFPPEAGTYLVDLGNNEYVVTFWNDPERPGVDTWGDERRRGWAGLSGSHARVQRWARMPPEPT